MTEKKNTRQLLKEHGVVLGGVKEVANALGTNTTNVTTWMSRRHSNGCPESLAPAGMGSIFDLNEWRQWHQGFVNKRPARAKVKEPQGPVAEESELA